MNLIHELIGGQWAQKTAKSLNQEIQFSNLATFEHFHPEFCELFKHLAIKTGWNDEDFNVWKEDFIREPKNTIDVLRALWRSWENNKYGVIDYEY